MSTEVERGHWREKRMLGRVEQARRLFGRRSRGALEEAH
jgi:hypothetical protein